MTRAMVAAHRGVAQGPGAPEAAENSIAAFTNAIDVGADMIEFDVRRTRDGELIAFHDAQVGTAPVGSLTRDEIAAATGTKPPLLAEVLAVCKDRIRLDVELKEDGYVQEVCALLPEGVIVTSFLDDVLRQVSRYRPGLQTGLLLGVARPRGYVRTRATELFPVNRLWRSGADFCAPHLRLARMGALARASGAGFPSLVWTVNDERELAALLADPRVSGVITDAPGSAAALRNAGASGGL